MVRYTQPLLNCLLRANHCNLCWTFRSVSHGNLISLKSSRIHNISQVVRVCEVPVVWRLLPNIMVCNKWSKNFSSLIQQSSTNYVYCHGVMGRYYSTERTRQSISNRSTLVYTTAVAIIVLGLSYAAVPLYRMFCQATGYGGTVSVQRNLDKVEDMKRIKEREITIKFNADTSPRLRWKFKPHQNEIVVVPGETALAFYSATNLTDHPITGIATYNVIPFSAGQYFHKVQCFCFEEQRLNPNEQVDMPVFFYIDPEFDDDPAVYKVNEITLSYTFFESTLEEELTPIHYNNSVDKSSAYST